jgi:UV DNA damage endonuclease
MSKKCNTYYKTFRLASFSEQRLYSTVIHNVQETERTIKQCILADCYMFRLSSDLVPFASHEVIKGINYINWINLDLKRIGKLAKDNNIRLSMHPSQMCVLSSPSQNVVKNSVKDLIYHYNILNTMSIKGDIVIHTGGVYRDKVSAMKRFIKIFKKLPEPLQNSIVLENDDKSYTINDVMKIYEYTGLKIVLDLHHHYCNNNGSKLDIKSVFNTWIQTNSIPKIHISSPKSSQEFRSHADMIDFKYVKKFIDKNDNKYLYDIMIEAKSKDLAVEQFKIDYKNNKINFDKCIAI